MVSDDYSDTEAFYEETNDEYVTEITVDNPEGNVAGNATFSSNNSAMPETGEESGSAVLYEYPERTLNVDFGSIRGINPEVIGWIYFENEKISYPVLYSGDNEKYLRTTYDGRKSSAGSIFLDGNASSDFSDHHAIIYGHNMKNGSMFGKLSRYIKNPYYYKSYSCFQIITEGNTYYYEIIGCKKVDVASNIYVIFPENSIGMKQFADAFLLKDSLIDVPTQITDEDHLITLSTCASDNSRFIVTGRRIN